MFDANSARNRSDDARFNNEPMMPYVFANINLACVSGKNEVFVEGIGYYVPSEYFDAKIELLKSMGYEVERKMDDEFKYGCIIKW